VDPKTTHLFDPQPVATKQSNYGTERYPSPTNSQKNSSKNLSPTKEIAIARKIKEMLIPKKDGYSRCMESYESSVNKMIAIESNQLMLLHPENINEVEQLTWQSMKNKSSNINYILSIGLVYIQILALDSSELVTVDCIDEGLKAFTFDSVPNITAMCAQNVQNGKSKQTSACFWACCKKGSITKYELMREGDGRMSEIKLTKKATFTLFSEQINVMRIVDMTKYIVGCEKSGVYLVKGTTELK
jgi:hypothetical protein